MEWEDLVQQAMNAKVGVTNPWVWGVGYITLMMATLPKFKKIVSEFDPSYDDAGRAFFSVWILVLWLTSPIWLGCLHFILNPAWSVTMLTTRRVEKVFSLRVR